MTFLMVNYVDPDTGKINAGLWVETVVVDGNDIMALVVTSKGKVKHVFTCDLFVVSNKRKSGGTNLNSTRKLF